MNRLGLKIVCVAVSLGIWVMVAATSPTEATIYLPVSLVNLNSEFTSEGSLLRETVRVRVSGSKLRLLAHNFFNRAAGKVEIDLIRETAGPEFTRRIAVSDIQTDLTILAIYQPNDLSLRIDNRIARLLPVQIELDGELPEDILPLERPTVVPDSVLVSGPERFFAPEMVVRTEAVALGGVHQSQQAEVSLLPPGDFLIPDQETVLVDVRVAQIEGRTLANIPVVPLIDADQAEVAFSPPVAEVMVRGPADSVRALVPARISVTIPLSGLAEGIHHMPRQLESPE